MMIPLFLGKSLALEAARNEETQLMINHLGQ